MGPVEADGGPAGADSASASNQDALGDVRRSPGIHNPIFLSWAFVGVSATCHRDGRHLFSPPEANPPVAGEPEILGSDRPNGGTRQRAGCHTVGVPNAE